MNYSHPLPRIFWCLSVTDVACLQDKEKCEYKILTGDFNATIGRTTPGEKVIGPYGNGERDNRGNRLVDFAEGQELYIMNSFYKKKASNKWTWKSSSGYTSKIDYIISSDKKYSAIVLSSIVLTLEVIIRMV